MVDALDSGSSEVTLMEVQLLSRAPQTKVSDLALHKIPYD